MALLANNIVLKPNMSKEHEGYGYYKEYQEGLSRLRADHPSGSLSLKRIGYPQVNRPPEGSGISPLPEIPPPIYMSPQKNIDGVMWAYCEGAPVIHPNGLADLPKNYDAIDLSGEVINIVFDGAGAKPDYAFFIMFKSGVLGSHFNIYDPEGDKIKESEEKHRKLKVQFAIRESLSEEKLRTVASAWGIANAGKRPLTLLQDELEELVFSNEERKKKDPMNPKLKGVGELLAEIKHDDVLRPGALVQYGIDEGRFKYEAGRYKWLFDGNDICDVPINKVDEKEAELKKFLTLPKNKTHWVDVMKALLTKEYLEKVDKYAVQYFCGQLDIALNQKEGALRTALLEAITAE